MVDKIAFTGSTEVGKEIMQKAAGTMKRVTLELGGKSPHVVFADSDIDRAVTGVLNGIYYNKGEVCSAGSRLLVESSIEDELLEKLVASVKKIRLGDPMEKTTRMGPQVSEAQMNIILGYVEAGVRDGARLLAGGKRHGTQGYFIEPCIFGGVAPSMTIAQEEIFGPVLAAIAFDDFDDCVAKANDSVYGLAAGVWTNDIKKAHRFAREVRAGTVWINTYGLFDSAAPFGGTKQSGFGREMGQHALESYTEVKSVWVDLS
jgi:acyl-CoA reductase-like NAD-dependent aldehyde dehydrogenase